MHRDLRSVLPERNGRRRAYTRTGAGDQYDFILQIFDHPLLL
jgi:hypothetical protein